MDQDDFENERTRETSFSNCLVEDNVSETVENQEILDNSRSEIMPTLSSENLIDVFFSCTDFSEQLKSDENIVPKLITPQTTRRAIPRFRRARSLDTCLDETDKLVPPFTRMGPTVKLYRNIQRLYNPDQLCYQRSPQILQLCENTTETSSNFIEADVECKIKKSHKFSSEQLLKKMGRSRSGFEYVPKPYDIRRQHKFMKMSRHLQKYRALQDTIHEDNSEFDEENTENITESDFSEVSSVSSDLFPYKMDLVEMLDDEVKCNSEENKQDIQNSDSQKIDDPEQNNIPKLDVQSKDVSEIENENEIEMQNTDWRDGENSNNNQMCSGFNELDTGTSCETIRAINEDCKNTPALRNLMTKSTKSDKLDGTSHDEKDCKRFKNINVLTNLCHRKKGESRIPIPLRTATNLTNDPNRRNNNRPRSAGLVHELSAIPAMNLNEISISERTPSNTTIVLCRHSAASCIDMRWPNENSAEDTDGPQSDNLSGLSSVARESRRRTTIDASTIIQDRKKGIFGFGSRLPRSLTFMDNYNRTENISVSKSPVQSQSRNSSNASLNRSDIVSHLESRRPQSTSPIKNLARINKNISSCVNVNTNPGENWNSSRKNTSISLKSKGPSYLRTAEYSSKALNNVSSSSFQAKSTSVDNLSKIQNNNTSINENSAVPSTDTILRSGAKLLSSTFDPGGRGGHSKDISTRTQNLSISNYEASSRTVNLVANSKSPLNTNLNLESRQSRSKSQGENYSGVYNRNSSFIGARLFRRTSPTENSSRASLCLEQNLPTNVCSIENSISAHNNHSSIFETNIPRRRSQVENSSRIANNKNLPRRISPTENSRITPNTQCSSFEVTSGSPTVKPHRAHNGQSVKLEERSRIMSLEDKASRTCSNTNSNLDSRLLRRSIPVENLTSYHKSSKTSFDAKLFGGPAQNSDKVHNRTISNTDKWLSQNDPMKNSNSKMGSKYNTKRPRSSSPIEISKTSYKNRISNYETGRPRSSGPNEKYGQSHKTSLSSSFEDCQAIGPAGKSGSGKKTNIPTFNTKSSIMKAANYHKIHEKNRTDFVSMRATNSENRNKRTDQKFRTDNLNSTLIERSKSDVTSDRAKKLKIDQPTKTTPRSEQDLLDRQNNLLKVLVAPDSSKLIATKEYRSQIPIAVYVQHTSVRQNDPDPSDKISKHSVAHPLSGTATSSAETSDKKADSKESSEESFKDSIDQDLLGISSEGVFYKTATDAMYSSDSIRQNIFFNTKDIEESPEVSEDTTLDSDSERDAYDEREYLSESLSGSTNVLSLRGSSNEEITQNAEQNIPKEQVYAHVAPNIAKNMTPDNSFDSANYNSTKNSARLDSNFAGSRPIQSGSKSPQHLTFLPESEYSDSQPILTKTADHSISKNLAESNDEHETLKAKQWQESYPVKKKLSKIARMADASDANLLPQINQTQKPTPLKRVRSETLLVTITTEVENITDSNVDTNLSLETNQAQEINQTSSGENLLPHGDQIQEPPLQDTQESSPSERDLDNSGHVPETTNNTSDDSERQRCPYQIRCYDNFAHQMNRSDLSGSKRMYCSWTIQNLPMYDQPKENLQKLNSFKTDVAPLEKRQTCTRTEVNPRPITEPQVEPEKSEIKISPIKYIYTPCPHKSAVTTYMSRSGFTLPNCFKMPWKEGEAHAHFLHIKCDVIKLAKRQTNEFSSRIATWTEEIRKKPQTGRKNCGSPLARIIMIILFLLTVWVLLAYGAILGASFCNYGKKYCGVCGSGSCTFGLPGFQWKEPQVQCVF